MPMCKTCQGEYLKDACLCPNCLRPLPRETNPCPQCHLETNDERLCPRCKSDVIAWEKETFSLLEFLRRWGALGLLPSVGAFGLWALFWQRHENSLHQFLTFLLTIAVCQLLIIILYATRDFWHEHWWASQIYDASSAPLPTTVSLTFIGGVILGVASIALYELWEPTSAGESVALWQQLLFGAAYVPTWVFFTASLTLLAIHDYIHSLNQRVPQPLYVQTRRLLQVAVESALQSQSLIENGNAYSRHKPSSNGSTQRPELLKVVRNRDNGGIRALVRVWEKNGRPGNSRPNNTQWIEKVWDIETDRWGRLCSITPGANRTPRPLPSK